MPSQFSAPGHFLVQPGACRSKAAWSREVAPGPFLRPLPEPVVAETDALVPQVRPGCVTQARGRLQLLPSHIPPETGRVRRSSDPGHERVTRNRPELRRRSSAGWSPGRLSGRRGLPRGRLQRGPRARMPGRIGRQRRGCLVTGEQPCCRWPARKPPARPGRSTAPRRRMPVAGTGSAPRTPARRARRQGQYRQIGDRHERGSRRAVAVSRRQAQPCQFAERALAGGVQPAEQGGCRRSPGDQHPCGAGRDLSAGRKMADRRAGQACQRRRAGRGGGGTRRYLRENRLQVAPRVIVNRITQPIPRLAVPHDQCGRHPGHPRCIADSHGVGAADCEEPQRPIRDTARE